MALQPQDAEFSLAGGLNTKPDPKIVPATDALVVSNVSFVTQGAVQQRYGSTTLSASVASGGTITAGIALDAPGTGSRLVMQDGTSVYTWAPNIGKWIKNGPAPALQLTTSLIGYGNTQQFNPSSAASGDVLVTTWSISTSPATVSTVNTVGYSVSSIATGIVYQQGTFASTYYARVVAVHGKIYSFRIGNTNSATISIYSFNVAAPATNAWVSVGTLATGVGNAVGLAVCQRTDQKAATDDSVYLAVFGDAASGTLYIANYDITTPGVTASFSTALGAATPNDMFITSALNLATPAFYFGYCSSGGAGAFSAVDSSYFASGTTTTLYIPNNNGIVGGGVTSTGAGFLFDTAPGSYLNLYSTAAARATLMFGIQAASHAAVRAADGFAYILATNFGANQITYFLIRSDGANVARFIVENGSAVALNTTQTYVMGSLADAFFIGDVLYTTVLVKTALRVDAAGQLYSTTGLLTVSFDFTDNTGNSTVTWDNEVFINSSMPQIFDGNLLVEAGYNTYPIIGLTLLDSGGHLTDSSVYTYYAVYEWQDLQGRWHRSAPSFAAQVTTTNTGSNVSRVVVNVTYCPRTLRTSATNVVNVAIYRTLDGGSVPYRVNGINGNLNKTDGALTFNYTDTSADTAIQVNDVLYSYATTGGQPLSELPNDPPPSFAYVTEGQRRIFGIPQDNRLKVWYSKLRQDDRAPEFSLAFVIEVEALGGNLTALGVLDQNLILFKKSRIYQITGSGPDDTGSPANGYSEPQLIASTDGCVSPKSLLKTDQGLFFQGNRGLLLLDRGLNLQYIGTPVEAYRADTITGALLVSAQNQLRFVTNNSVTLVYDYLLSKWSTYDYGGVGAALWNGVPVVLSAAGVVRQEVSGNYADSGTGVHLQYQTAWFKPGQIAQGFAKVWEIEVLGTYEGIHVLYIDIYYDYSTTASYTLTYTPAGTGTYQFRSRIPRARCEAISFRFRPVNNAGASCQLTSLALHLGVIGGLNRLPKAQTG